MSKRNRIEIFAFVIISIVYLITILPLLYMGRYIHPLWDDYGSASWIHNFMEKKYYLLVLLTPLGNVIGSWILWQGTYAAEFLFPLQPGAWIVPAYWITPLIIIASMTVGYIIFWRNLSREVFRNKSIYGSLIAIALLIIQFQYVPHIHSAFYWFNGSIYYSFFFAMMLIELSQVFCVINGSKYNKKLVVILAIVVSGGNLSTALINVLILILLNINAIIIKKEKNLDLKHITIAAIIGLLVSMIAPGNAVRAAQCISMPPIKAIISSIVFSLKNIKHWLGFPQIGLLILLTPILFLLVRNIRLSFKNMLVDEILLFLLFAAQATPPFYAMSFAGDERQIDMYYYSFYMLISLGMTCFIAWIKSLNKFELMENNIKKVAGVSGFIFGFVIMIIGIMNNEITNLNSFKVLDEIVSGRASAYDKEFNEKIQMIENSDEICYVSEIENYTEILPPFGIDIDPDYWVNEAMANYYGLKRLFEIEKD